MRCGNCLWVPQAAGAGMHAKLSDRSPGEKAFPRAFGRSPGPAMTVETVHAQHALTERGWEDDVLVTLEGGRIRSLQRGPDTGAEKAAILLPAPANLHSHAFQRAMSGLCERKSEASRDSFWTWRRFMYRFLDRLEPKDVEAIAAFAMMEMAEAGFASVAEFHYLHHLPGGKPYANPAEMCDRIAAAARTTGLGLTLLPVLYQHGGCDRRPLAAGQLRFGSDIDGFARLFGAAESALATLPDDCRIGVAAHSLRAVDRAGLDAAAMLAPGSPVHMHLAEQAAEVEEVVACLGARPGEWLFDNAEVDGRWCLIHCTQLERHELARLAGSGAVAGLCPVTEASLGDGIFDGAAFRGECGRFGVGTDSNIRVSLSEELRALEYSQRLRDRSRAVLADPGQSCGRAIFDAVVEGGCRAAGRGSGAIAPGRVADLVALEGGAVDLAARSGDRYLDAFAFSGDNRMVRDLWSAGRHIVREGRHVAHDAVRDAYLACLRRLTEGL